MGTRENAFIFSDQQAITASAASNYAGTGFGLAGAGVFDTQAENSISDSPHKFPLIITVGIPFQGVAGITLLAVLQESNDLITWFTSDLSDVVAETMTFLQRPGYTLLKGPLPSTGAGPTGGLARYLRCFYTLAGGTPTAGTVNAWLDCF